MILAFVGIGHYRGHCVSQTHLIQFCFYFIGVNYFFNRCVIFISSPSLNNGEPIKLDRNVKVPVFDFLGYFETMLQQYLRGYSRKPMAHFLVGFGQKLISNNTDLSGLLISAQVYHSRAKYRLNQVSV